MRGGGCPEWLGPSVVFFPGRPAQRTGGDNPNPAGSLPSDGVLALFDPCWIKFSRSKTSYLAPTGW
jgi:hypothetical protein